MLSSAVFYLTFSSLFTHLQTNEKVHNYFDKSTVTLPNKFTNKVFKGHLIHKHFVLYKFYMSIKSKEIETETSISNMVMKIRIHISAQKDLESTYDIKL